MIPLTQKKVYMLYDDLGRIVVYTGNVDPWR